MEAVLFALVAIFAVLFGAGVFAAVKAKRALERRVPQAIRRAEDVALRARAVARPGPVGRIAGLRVELRSSLDATRRVLEADAARGDGALTDALDLVGQLEQQAAVLDEELRVLEREPSGSAGRSRLETKLPELRDRAERIGHAADSLRWAAQDRARHDAEDELTRLTREVELEAGALRHWAPAADGVEGGAGRGVEGGPGGGVGAAGVEDGDRRRKRLR